MASVVNDRALSALHTRPSVTRYWEERARRFAADGQGLRAVCSYGMPWFYNHAIQITQQLALEPWLNVPRSTAVLDVGCGVGRWSRHMATRGAKVTGIDLSPTMIAEATARAHCQGLSDRCRFVVQDAVYLDLAETFDQITCVTVLQHLPESERALAALDGFRRHLARGGRIVLLEAAPNGRWDGTNGRNFVARDFREYRALFDAAGLALTATTGVDTAPLKKYILPLYRRLPHVLAVTALAAATGVSLPIDVILGRLLTSASWHKVMVLERATYR